MTRSPRTLRIATRQSALALWQAHHIANQLRALYPQLTVELRGMTTQGDKIQHSSLAKIGGKGLFVKELEQSLLEKSTDLAVHSLKDVPVELPEGLTLAVILPRAEVRDAWVSRYALNDLPSGARIGTSSLRRSCQLSAHYPHFQIESLRGNVDTRLAKLDAGHYDGIVLAAAGLQRLGLGQRIHTLLPTELSLPAIGQGALGIECRVDDQEVLALLKPLDDLQTHLCIRAERAMNTRLHGGCQVPIAGYATLQENALTLTGLVGELDGSRLIKSSLTGWAQDAEQIGIRVAENLLAAGADDILRRLYGADANP